MTPPACRARYRERLFCSSCGLPIGEEETCYAMPDGWTVCAESDCLADWAAPYRRRQPVECFWEECEE